MVKYIIEDGIDFWDEIKKTDIENYDNICLITKETLTLNNITLPCNHKFNYIPLFNETLTNKLSKNKYYNNNLKLKKTQIICPYCRNIIDGLMPYIPSLKDEKINNVNYPFKYCLPLLNCNFKNCKSDKAYNCNDNVFCLKHHNLTKHKQVISTITINMTPEMKNYSKKYNIKQIKEILKLNKIKYSGVKNVLINRIFNNNLHNI